MVSIYFDSSHEDSERRRNIYSGDIYVFSSRPSTAALCRVAREMSEEAFAPRDPQLAQFELPVEEYAGLLAELKPRFMHDPRVRDLVRALLRDFGCPPEQTYFDVPRMRTMTHGDYLRSGIALAVPPHRDTWYAGSQSQLNWWFPIYDLVHENTMVFYPRYFRRAVVNSSGGYDHAAWIRWARQEAAKHVKADTRAHPEIQEEVDAENEVRVLCPVDGLILFSASHLHATVPNTSGKTRFSVDFRTTDLPDLMAERGAPNPDSEHVGTTLGEYRRLADLDSPPGDAVRSLEGRARLTI